MLSRLWLVLLLGSAAAGEYGAPKVIANVSIPKLNESSGLAASRTYPGVFWSHNDSGGGAYIYAFHRSGNSLGRWRVSNARSNDWEDMAIGPGPKKGASYLFIADAGDNDRVRRDITVYRVPEPNPRKAADVTAPAEPIRLRYPDGAHDSECLMVHPTSGDLYIVTKARGNDPGTVVYKASAPFNTKQPTLLERVAEIDLPESPLTLIVGRVTGGDISPDGTRAVLCDYFNGWEAVLPKGARKFDAIWTAPWRKVDVGLRRQGEAIAYRHDGKAIVATSEGVEFPLIEAERR